MAKQQKLKPKELLEHWKDLAGDESGRPWSDEDAFGFFQRFRPRGEGAEQAFDGLAYAPQMTARLMEVYAATTAGYRKSDLYFQVRRSPILSKPAMQKLGRSLLDNLKAMAQLEPELAASLKSSDVLIQPAGSRKNNQDDTDEHELAVDICSTSWSTVRLPVKSHMWCAIATTAEISHWSL